MEKILIITYYWPPSGGPGVQRWLKFARYLPQLGYEPLIITVSPQQANYPVLDASLEKEVPPELKVYHTATLEPYSVYKRISGRQQAPYSGFTNEKKSGLFSAISRFIRGNLFVPDARVGWNRYALAQARELIKEYNIQKLITTSPPHSTQLVGKQLKKELPHIQWIADLRDPWTDIFYYRMMLHLPFIRKRDLEMEKQVLRNADKVITVSDYIRKKFREKIPHTQADKISVITNGFDPDDFEYTPRDSSRDGFTIAYIGTMTDEYELSGFLQALSYLKEAVGNKIFLEFTGSVSEKWKSILSQQREVRVQMSGHTDHQTAIKRMQSADLLLLAIPLLEHNEGIVTGKIFEYMASGRPVIGVGPPHGDAAALLARTRSGKMFNYMDVPGIRSFIEARISDRASWKPHQEQINAFSREELTKQLIQLF